MTNSKMFDLSSTGCSNSSQEEVISTEMTREFEDWKGIGKEDTKITAKVFSLPAILIFHDTTDL